jgi:hypothetical protein
MANKTIKIGNFEKLKSRKHNWLRDWKVKRLQDNLNEYFILLESEMAVGEVRINKMVYDNISNIPCVGMSFTYTTSTTNHIESIQIPIEQLKSFTKFRLRLSILIESAIS